MKNEINSASSWRNQWHRGIMAAVKINNGGSGEINGGIKCAASASGWHAAKMAHRRQSASASA